MNSDILFFLYRKPLSNFPYDKRARGYRNHYGNRDSFSLRTGSEICNKSNEKFPTGAVRESGSFQVPPSRGSKPR